MASSVAKTTHSPPEIQSISIENAPDLKTDNALPPQEGTGANHSEAEPTAPTRQDGEDGFLTAEVRRQILNRSYQKRDGFWAPAIRRFENLSLANLFFYQIELRKLEREIIDMNVEGCVSESAVQRLRPLLKEYRM
jgi:hypothetical protein